MMQERGVSVDHSMVNRRTIRFLLLLENILRRQKRAVGGSWRMDETYITLSPLSFIARSAYVYPQRPAVVQGTRRYTWSETHARCRRLASTLVAGEVAAGDAAAALLPNTPEMYD